jgi:hypothetical protein
MSVVRSWIFRSAMLMVLGLSLVITVIPKVGQAAVPVAVAGETSVEATQLAAATYSNGLAFQLPAASTHKKFVFAHYWPPGAISVDNGSPSSDYVTQYLKATGEYGKHFSVGGLQRDRSATINPSSNTATVAVNIPSSALAVDGEIGDEQLDVPQWMIDEMKVEIARARSAGIDGFALNLFNLTDLTKDNGPREIALLKAASETGFKIMLQPDMSIMDSCGSYAAQYNSTVDGQYSCMATAKRMAKNLKAFIDIAGSAVYRINGKVVISPFVADQEGAAGVAYWKRVLADLNSFGAGYAANMYPVFVFPTNAMINAYAPISVGVSFWGCREPKSIAAQDAIAKRVKGTAALGSATQKLKWMQAVAVQDARPKDGQYHEAANTGTLRASWDRAITGQVGKWLGKSTRTKDVAADMVLLTTWNDYTETTAFSPSVTNGWSIPDINAYYMTKFQTGSYPKITRNAVYVSHRVQFTGAKPSLAYKTFWGTDNGRADGNPKLYTYNVFQSYNKKKGGKETADRTVGINKVEVLTMLTKKTKVKVTIGSKTYTFTALAGVRVKSFALRKGYVKAQLLKGKKAVATAATGDKVTTQVTEDLGYHFASSLR